MQDEFGMEKATSTGRPKTWEPSEIFAQIGDANLVAFVCKAGKTAYTGSIAENVKVVQVPVSVSGAKKVIADFASADGWTIVGTVRNVIRAKRNVPVTKPAPKRAPKAKR